MKQLRGSTTSIKPLGMSSEANPENRSGLFLCCIEELHPYTRKRHYLRHFGPDANHLNHASYSGSIVRMISSSFKMRILLFQEEAEFTETLVVRNNKNRTLMKEAHTQLFFVLSSLSDTVCLYSFFFFASFVVNAISGNSFMQTTERDKSFVWLYYKPKERELGGSRSFGLFI